MADDIADDVSTEITLDDFNADAQQPAKAEPSPAPEAKAEDKTEAKGKEETPKGDDTPEVPDVPLKEEGKAEETPENTENKPTKAEERKDQLNTEIRDLVAQKNALKAEVEKTNAEVYQPATEEELTEQGMNAIEAKVEAMRQEREMEKYNSQVADAQLTIGHESQRVLDDFPMFNPDNESYDKELAEEAAELLQANLIIDPNTNQVIGSNVSPYQLYKTLARASGISAVKGEIKGQANTEKQLANVDATSNAAPPNKPQTAEQKLIDMWKSDD